MVTRIRGAKRVGKQRACRARRVRIGEPDERLTGCAGVAAVTETDRVLGLSTALERHIVRSRCAVGA